jgi:hypothetical protein
MRMHEMAAAGHPIRYQRQDYECDSKSDKRHIISSLISMHVSPMLQQQPPVIPGLIDKAIVR